MCELFGISANRKIRIDGFLTHFFNHSKEHPNGWGMAFFDGSKADIEKEPCRAEDSLYLKKKLSERIVSSRMVAHIRKATKGEICLENTHPFEMRDESGRNWVLVHNGTIFESKELSPYQYKQTGGTDSERILLYIVDRINSELEEELNGFDANERIRLIDSIVRTLAEHNKLNLLIYDGDYFYVHKNEEGTLYMSKKQGSVLFSTHPLSDKGWEEVPQNRLIVYKDGEEVYVGDEHPYTYILSKEDEKLLYLEYAAI